MVDALLLAHTQLTWWSTVATIVGGFGVVVGLFTFYVRQIFDIRERQRQNLFDISERQHEQFRRLEFAWYLGELSQHRINAERILRDESTNADFRELQEGLISAEGYRAVSAVLRFFYIVDSWRHHGYIDTDEAIRSLRVSYRWWYDTHIGPRAVGLLPDKKTDQKGVAEWIPIVQKHDWLYGE